MKSACFYVKSNYIKNTQKDWVLCDGKLLYHQNITFLNLKSIKDLSDRTWDQTSNVSHFVTLPRSGEYNGCMPQWRAVNLNVLCNLSEFKSCEIKSVKLNGISKFAIKLIPAGLFNSKKLFLLPEVDECLTEWCGLLSGFIAHCALPPPPIDETRSMCSTLRPQSLATFASSSVAAPEVYVALDDNDAYEAGNQTEYYVVTVEPTESSLQHGLSGKFVFQLSPDALELLTISSRQVVHTFPYPSIRRFGAKLTLLRLEAGRRCSTGNGIFTFLTAREGDADHIAAHIKDNARRLKAASSLLDLGGSRLLHDSCQSLNRQLSPVPTPRQLLPCQSAESLTRAAPPTYAVPHKPLTTQAPPHQTADTPAVHMATVAMDSVPGTTVVKTPSPTTSIDTVAIETVAKSPPSSVSVDVTEKSPSRATSIDTNDAVSNEVKSASSSLPVVSAEAVRESAESDKLQQEQNRETLQIDEDQTHNVSLTEPRPNSLFSPKPEENTIPQSPSSLSEPLSLFFPSLPPPPPPPTTTASDFLPEYKVTQSSFFRYRQQTPSSLPPTSVSPVFAGSNSFRNARSFLHATAHSSQQVVPMQTPQFASPQRAQSLSKPKTTPPKSPPPATLPKPKLPSTPPPPVPSYDTQSSYREFDQMIKDLELSFV